MCGSSRSWYPATMTEPQPNPDPDPDTSSGLERGGGPVPGETPPAEGSMSGAGPDESHNPTKGWARGPLVALAVLVALFVAFFLTYAIWIWTN